MLGWQSYPMAIMMLSKIYDFVILSLGISPNKIQTLFPFNPIIVRFELAALEQGN